MITLIIMAVLMAGATGIFYLVSKAKIKEPKEIVDKTSFEQEMSMFWLVVCMMIIPIFTIFCIAPLVQSTQEKEFVEQKRTVIYSIKTETGMYGSFCLGYGQIQTEMYYFYYTQGDFGYKIEKTKANNIEIVERDDIEKIGHIVKYEEKFVKPSIWYSFSGEVIFAKKKTVIYVPKGTIQIEYNISV